MAAALSNSQTQATISTSLVNTGVPSSTTSTINHTVTSSPATGSAAGQVSKVYSAPFTIAASGTPTTLDLTSLADPQGNTQNFGTVYKILVSNDSVVAGQDIAVGGGTNGLIAASTTPVYANGGALLWDLGTTGLATDSTHKIIQLAVAAGTAVVGKITVLGK